MNFNPVYSFVAMKEIKPTEIKENAIRLIADDWMLVTAGRIDSFNMMTASWGMIGEMWGMPVAETVVRPQRYTHEFIEREGRFTLSFFGNEIKSILGVMGSKSGRDIDKMHYLGLTAIELPDKQVGFAEARLTLECEVVYADDFKPEAFKDSSLIDKWYDNDLHTRYIGRIVKVWTTDD